MPPASPPAPVAAFRARRPRSRPWRWTSRGTWKCPPPRKARRNRCRARWRGVAAGNSRRSANRRRVPHSPRQCRHQRASRRSARNCATGRTERSWLTIATGPASAASPGSSGRPACPAECRTGHRTRRRPCHRESRTRHRRCPGPASGRGPGWSAAAGQRS